MLIRDNAELLPKKNILFRCRKYVRKCYSTVKVNYGVHNLFIQQETYDQMCTTFTEGIDIATEEESSYKFLLDWVQKAMKDILQQIHCESIKKIVTSKVSCGSNNVKHVINDAVVVCHKGHSPYLRKQFSISKKPSKKNKIA